MLVVGFLIGAGWAMGNSKACIVSALYEVGVGENVSFGLLVMDACGYCWAFSWHGLCGLDLVWYSLPTRSGQFFISWRRSLTSSGYVALNRTIDIKSASIKLVERSDQNPVNLEREYKI